MMLPSLLVLVLPYLSYVSAGCTAKAACMKCLIPDALANTTAASNYSTNVDPCLWPGVTCNLQGNVTSIVLDGLALTSLNTSCIPDTAQRLSAVNTTLSTAIAWRGHPNMQSIDFSRNPLRGIVSNGTFVDPPPTGYLGLIGTFNALQSITANQMSFAAGFNMTFIGLPALTTVVADTDTITKQVYIRNCSALQMLRVRGVTGYAFVSDQTVTSTTTPTPLLGVASVTAAIVVQSAVSLISFACLGCSLVTAVLSCTLLTNVTIAGANFGTVLASKAPLATATQVGLLSGSPQLSGTAGLLVAGATGMQNFSVTSSSVSCFDLGAFQSLKWLDMSGNNIAGIVTNTAPSASAVTNRTCPFAGPAQLNYQPSVLLEVMIAPSNKIVSFDKRSQYSTLRQLNLANNSLQSVFVCGQPCATVDVSFNAILTGEVCSRRVLARSGGSGSSAVNATATCCGGVTSLGGDPALKCGCTLNTSPATAPVDYTLCLATTYVTPSNCTLNAPLYDPNVSPNANPNPIFTANTTMTAQLSTSLPGIIEVTVRNVGLSQNTFPVFLAGGRAYTGSNLSLTNITLQSTMATSVSPLAFGNFRFDAGLPDAYRPNQSWTGSLDLTTCTAQYVYRINTSNFGNDAFLTTGQSGTLFNATVDVALVEALPVALNNATWNNQTATRRVVTARISLEPPLQVGCGMLLRGNYAPFISRTNLSIVNYGNVTPTHIVSGSIDNTTQVPAGYFAPNCTVYVPSLPALPEGLRCTGGAFSQLSSVKTNVSLVTITNGVQKICPYQAQPQLQAPVFMSATPAPGDTTTQPPLPAGTFSSTTGTAPVVQGTVMLYVATSSTPNVTVKVVFSQLASGFAISITDDPTNAFKCQQFFDATQQQVVLAFQPIAGIYSYPGLFLGSSITAAVTVVSSNSSSRRQAAVSSTAGDQIVFALDPSVTQLAGNVSAFLTTNATSPQASPSPNSTSALLPLSHPPYSTVSPGATRPPLPSTAGTDSTSVSAVTTGILITVAVVLLVAVAVAIVLCNVSESEEEKYA